MGWGWGGVWGVRGCGAQDGGLGGLRLGYGGAGGFRLDREVLQVRMRSYRVLEGVWEGF